ncbi:MAG: adenylate kinase [Actinomycetota bacterium]
MRLILLGPAGAGKGTQAERLVARFKIPHVSTGDILRAAVANETEVGKLAREHMESGGLVPDAVVLGVMREWLASKEATDGYVLDGFPRTVPQAEALEGILRDHPPGLNAAVLVDVPDQVILERLSVRWSCPKCGLVYSAAASNRPKNVGYCDRDGTALQQRGDDSPAVIRHRLDVYREQTAPLIGFYESRNLLKRIDGVGTPDEIEERILKEIS